MRGHDRAQCIVHLGRLLVQLAHFGRQRLDLGGLGDVVGCLARLISLIAQGAELLDVVGVLIQAGRLDDDSAAPSRYIDKGFGGRGAAGSAWLGLAGLGQRSLARHLVPGIAADTAAPIRGAEAYGRSLRLFPIRPPVVAVSEKILAIWGAERRGPGAK